MFWSGCGLFNCFDTYNPSKPPFDKGGLCPPMEENSLLQICERVPPPFGVAVFVLGVEPKWVVYRKNIDKNGGT